MIDFRKRLIFHLRKQISQEEYKSLCRGENKKSFRRKRVFSLTRLIVIIMFLQKSYQQEINNFCDLIYGGKYNIKTATAGALSQARAKLNPKAFTHLTDLIIDRFYGEADYQKWNGYRLLAVDGSVLNLPYSKSIIKEFGYEKYIKKGSGKKSMARCSILYDVQNQITLDAQIDSYKTSEKALFQGHLEKIQSGDLILGDRGYGLNSIIYAVLERDADYCIRLTKHKMNKFKTFMKSKRKEQVIEIKVNPETIGVPKTSKVFIKMRLVKIKLDSGEIELLGTSLIDNKKYNTKVLKDLYHLRWKVEEAYKMLKTRVNIEEWSGRTARSIHQDFHAKILMMNLCAALSFPIEKKVREEYKKENTGNKYDQKINRANALSETKNSLIKILLNKAKYTILKVIDKVIRASRTIIRPNRKNKRVKILRKRKALNYKRI